MEKERLGKYVESNNKRLLNAMEGKGILGGRKNKKEVIEAKEMETSWRSYYYHSF